MNETALVTGASSGIGRELARCHAARGGDLIVTARREAELAALKDELEARHRVAVQVIALDLGAPGGAAALLERIAEAGLQVDVLINNAGFGGHGRHVERDRAEDLAMIDLDVRALVTLTHALAGEMVRRGRGRILNVGSTAGFMPGPQQTVYYACKAFVNSYSQALGFELSGTGVTCTLLAPGYVETGFAARGGLEGTHLARTGGPDAARVARLGYDAMRRGDRVVISQWSVRLFVNWIAPLMPRRGLLAAVDRLQSK